MTLSKIENKFTSFYSFIAFTLLVGIAIPCSAQSDESPSTQKPANYVHIETQRVIKLQDENRLLLKRVNSMKEKMEAMQAELLSVRNAYMEREDIIPRTQKEISSRYEKQIALMQEEIRTLKKELDSQRRVYDALDGKHSRILDELSGASRSKSDLQSRIGSLETELSKARERLAGHEKKNSEIIGNLAQKDREQRGLQERITKIEKDRNEERKNLNDQIARLKKEKDAAVSSHEESLKVSRKEGESTIKELQKQTDGKIKELQKQTDEKIKELQKQADGKIRELQSQNEELAKSRVKEIETLNRNIQTLNKDKEGLSAQLAKAQEQSAGLTSGKEALTSQINELNARLGEWQTKTDELSHQLKARDIEIAALQESNRLTAQSASDASVRLIEKEREFQGKLAAQQEADKTRTGEHANALEALKNDLALKEAQIVSLQTKEQANVREQQIKLDALEGKLAFAQQQVREFREKADVLAQQNSSLELQFKDATAKFTTLQKEKAELARAKEAQSTTGEEVAMLKKKADELRGKLQERGAELQSAQKENELLLSQLIRSKDERIKLNDEISGLNKAIFELTQAQLPDNAASPQEMLETQETMIQLTRELLAAENAVYEKELIIEGLRSDQKNLQRALEISQGNYALLKAELESLKISEVSYNGRDNVLDLELNKLEERVERQVRGR